MGRTSLSLCHIVTVDSIQRSFQKRLAEGTHVLTRPSVQTLTEQKSANTAAAICENKSATKTTEPTVSDFNTRGAVVGAAISEGGKKTSMAVYGPEFSVKRPL